MKNATRLWNNNASTIVGLSGLLTRRRRGRREQTKLPHHSNVVPICKMLSDLAIEYPIHVHVLNLESATRGLHTDEHSAIDRKA